MTEQRWVIDLDGVVWRQEQPIKGAADAVARLRAAGVVTAFFTNNSYPRHAELIDRLAHVGIDVAPAELLSSPQSAAMLCRSGERALVVGGEGVREALEGAGVVVTQVTDVDPADPGTFDVLVVGIDPHFDYQRLTAASAVVRAGARFVGTNDDATFPLPDRLVPGAGSVLAAIATASGVSPEIAGKPYPASAALVRARLGPVDLVVGDKPATDGALADELGVAFGLVDSGVTPPGTVVTPEPTYRAADLAALVTARLGA